MPRKKDLTGMKFGMLTVLHEAERDSRRKVTWHCRCDCGKELDVLSCYLLGGKKKCCGCSTWDILSAKNRRHGETNTRLHKTWQNMRNRCRNKNSKDYPDYGGRGIKVCDDWINSYESFRDWAVVSGYSDGLSIDRIDVNGDYCPENCRWVTQKEQSRNTRRNIHVEKDGFSGCLLDYCVLNDLNYHTVISRLNLGWPIEEAISSTDTIKNYRKKEIMLTYHGKTMNATAWCKELGIPKTNLFRRLDKGWDTEKCFETPFRKRRKKEKQ